MTKASLKPHCTVLALVAFTLLTLPGASAQTSPAEKKIDEIEKQLQTLKQMVEDLRRTPSTNEISSPPAADTTPPRARSNTNDPVARIRDEGLNRSQLMPALSYLTDVIGPRLTGSPNLKRANEWTRDKLASWGLSHAHLEAWGPFGQGWSLKRFSVQVIEPYAIPLIAYPKAWSPGFAQPLVAEVIYLDARTEADLDKFKGKLKGAVVLASLVRDVRARFEPLAIRLVETNLLRLANANPPPASSGGRGRSGSGRRGGPATGRPSFPERVLSFAMNEGAVAVITTSSRGDGGTIFVQSASLPTAAASRNSGPTPRVWSTNAPATAVQIALAVEDYNRLVRMSQEGEKLKVALEMQVEFHNDDLMGYNTIAEIPGSDLKDEIVMLGAHLDSWHCGTGATDNGAGVVAVMEAARIIAALKLQPRRTIRVGLWTGEEQGLLGSTAYVTKHFGYYTNLTNTISASSTPEPGSGPAPAPAETPRPRSTGQVVRGKDYEKFSAYFNLDNGTGKIRGVYMQGNEAVRPLFRRWLEPFSDLGAETLTISNTGATDHVPFDAIGLPGFQFIQDPIEYNSRTHHSTADVFDRIQADDLKQAATIMAAFLYHAAMLDEKLPRKP
jgi:carboxypeptidase Q